MNDMICVNVCSSERSMDRVATHELTASVYGIAASITASTFLAHKYVTHSLVLIFIS